MQTTPQQYRPALSNWLRSEGYDSPDEDWATPYQNGEAVNGQDPNAEAAAAAKRVIDRMKARAK